MKAEPQHCASVCEAMWTNRQNSNFCDLIIHTTTSTLYAHAVVLASASPELYLRIAPCSDATQKGIKYQLDLRTVGCDHVIMLNLLSVCYTGILGYTVDNSIQNLYAVAQYLGLKKVAMMCLKYMQRVSGAKNSGSNTSNLIKSNYNPIKSGITVVTISKGPAVERSSEHVEKSVSSTKSSTNPVTSFVGEGSSANSKVKTPMTDMVQIEDIKTEPADFDMSCYDEDMLSKTESFDTNISTSLGTPQQNVKCTSHSSESAKATNEQKMDDELIIKTEIALSSDEDDSLDANLNKKESDKEGDKESEKGTAKKIDKEMDSERDTESEDDTPLAIRIKRAQKSPKATVAPPSKSPASNEKRKTGRPRKYNKSGVRKETAKQRKKREEQERERARPTGTVIDETTGRRSSTRSTKHFKIRRLLQQAQEKRARELHQRELNAKKHRLYSKYKDVIHCKQCKTVFNTEDELSTHKKIFANKLCCKLKCPFRGCNRRVPHKDALSDHFAKVHPEKMEFKCPVEKCGFVHYIKMSVMRHVDDKHGFTEDYLKCLDVERTILKCKHELCDFTSIYSATMQFHESSPHSDDIDCELCGKTYYSRQAFKRHMTAIHRTWHCLICAIEFQTLIEYNVHMEEHKDIKRTREKHDVMCDDCGEQISASHDLIELHRHKWKQHNIDPPSHVEKYQCDLCDYVTLCHSSFIGHRKRHFKVDKVCPTCGKRVADLKGHMLCHVTTKDYACDLCDYVTSRKGNIAAHKRHVHGEHLKFYECHLCPYRPKSNGNLRLHLRNVHKVEPPPRKMNTLVRYSAEEPTTQPEVSTAPMNIINEHTSTTVTQSKHVAPSSTVTPYSHVESSNNVTPSLSFTSSAIVTSLESHKSRQTNTTPAVQTMDTA